MTGELTACDASRPCARNPALVLVSNCGFPDPSCFKYFRSLFDFLRESDELPILAEIFLAEGPLLTVPAPPLKPIIDAYLGLVRQAGGEVVTDGRLSSSTIAALEKPLMPHDLYVRLAHQHWDAMLNKA